MKDPNVRPKRVCSPRYAVLKARKGKTLNRWEIEELAKDHEQSLIYAQKVLRGRFLEGEAAIAQDHNTAFEYARTVIRGRFEAAEKTFLENNTDWGNCNYLRRYFIELAQEPNPEVERLILQKYHGLADEYAEKCLKGRWKRAEKVILKTLDNAVDYHKNTHKARWPELEDLILFRKKGHWDNHSKAFAQYLSVVQAPIPELEKKLETCKRASLLLVYAMKGVRGRLPKALHQKMVMLSFDPKKQKYAKSYVKFLESCEVRAARYLSQLDDQERADFVKNVETNMIF